MSQSRCGELAENKEAAQEVARQEMMAQNQDLFNSVE